MLRLWSAVADAQARALVYTAQHSSEDPGGPGQAALGSRKFSGTPDWLRGGQLHGYQLEGLNWLFH
ncbi:uncharacterized protein HaLaN_26116, partial [Haematococcus lacustris]